MIVAAAPADRQETTCRSCRLLTYDLRLPVLTTFSSLCRARDAPHRDDNTTGGQQLTSYDNIIMSLKRSSYYTRVDAWMRA